MRKDIHLNNLKKHRRRNSRAIKLAATGKTGKKRKSDKRLFIAAGGLILLYALVLTLNEYIFKSDILPCWNDIFVATDLNGTVINGEDVDAPVSVHFIDVGQGDCELIITPTKTVLIDCGESEYSAVVISYLRACGIESLDYIITTHPHSDHIGGMSEVINCFGADFLIMPRVAESITPTTSSYMKMLNAADEKGITLQYAKAGTRLALGTDCTLELLSPVADYDDLNNYSVTVRFTHGNNVFLFTGDIETAAEKDILDSGVDISADVLKIAHHGSSSSSSKAFLQAVNPQYAVIEVGSPNDYGHPTEKTLNRLSDLGIAVLRTDYMGSIVFKSDTNLLRAYYTEK